MRRRAHGVAAALVHAADPFHVFRRVILLLAVLGILSAGLLVLVNSVADFELTFLLSGGGLQTLVVALYYAEFAAGMRPIYSVDAMAVISMALVLALLIVALLRAADADGVQTQMVFRLGSRRQPAALWRLCLASLDGLPDGGDDPVAGAEQVRERGANWRPGPARPYDGDDSSLG